MRIRTGQYKITLSERAQAETVMVRVWSTSHPHSESGYWMMLSQINARSLPRTPSEPGLPVSFCMSGDGDTITLDPPSDRARTILIRYCPAMKEI